MQLTITTWDDRIISVELDQNDHLDNLRATLEVETGLPSAEQVLFHNGRLLTNSQTLGEQQVQPGDLIFMQAPRLAPQPAGAASGLGAVPAARRPAAQNSAAFNPDGSAVDPGFLIQAFNNPAQLSQLPTDLADAVRAGDINKLQDGLRRLARQTAEVKEEELRFIRMAEEDPFNPEVQRRLEQIIQQKNVNENYEQAIEYNPEAFGDVCMLYVNMEVNGVPLKAFVDSGAQTTIMGQSCAERCGLLRLLDKRFSGMASGVGTAKILGRIHMAPLKAGAHFFPFSITVLDQNGMEFLFGLDNLKRHQCMIDLKDNVLRFGTTGTALPFLAEHEIPNKGKGLLSGPEGSPEAPMPDAAPSPQQQQHLGGASAAPAPAAGPSGAPAAGPSSTPATAPPATAPAPVGGGVPAGWEEKVQELQNLGFPRDQCFEALRQTGGNMDFAASLLFGGF